MVHLQARNARRPHHKQAAPGTYLPTLEDPHSNPSGCQTICFIVILCIQPLPPCDSFIILKKSVGRLSDITCFSIIGGGGAALGSTAQRSGARKALTTNSKHLFPTFCRSLSFSVLDEMFGNMIVHCVWVHVCTCFHECFDVFFESFHNIVIAFVPV